MVLGYSLENVYNLNETALEVFNDDLVQRIDDPEIILVVSSHLYYHFRI